jgi:hypothetical protein
VTRWHGGDQRERWVGFGLLVAEWQFRRVRGNKLVAVPQQELKGHAISVAVAVQGRNALQRGSHESPPFSVKAGIPA